MHIHSSPPQSHHGDTSTISTIFTSRPQCDWSDTDETELINFLVEHKAEAGDSAMFKASVWNAAAQHLEQFRTKGGPKAANSCSAKWSRVRGTASDIDYLLTTVLAQGFLQHCYHTQKFIWF